MQGTSYIKALNLVFQGENDPYLKTVEDEAEDREE